MLLPFRWLFYGTSAEETTSGTRRHRKIQRKLRRLAQWTEAIAPPRVDVVAPVVASAVSAEISIGTPRVSIAAAVASAVSAEDALGTAHITIGTPRVSIGVAVASAAQLANAFGVSADLIIGEVNVIADVDLFDYEIAALMAA